MTKEEKEEIIDAKCDEAGCDDKKRARHREMFIAFQSWDVHPKQEFQDYVMARWEREELQDKEACRETGRQWRPTDKPNVVTLWNSDRERQEFYKSRAEL